MTMIEQINALRAYYNRMYELSGVQKPKWLLENKAPESVFQVDDSDSGLEVRMDGPIDSLFGGLDSKQIISKLKETPDKDLKVTLTTPGGNLNEGLQLHGYLSDRAKEGNVSIRGQGLVASAGAVIFLAAPLQNRTLSNGTMFMVHGSQAVHLAVGNRYDIKDSADRLYEVMKDNDENLHGIVNSSTEVPEKELKNWLEKEKFLTKNKAIEYGIASEDTEADAQESEGNQDAELDEGIKAYLDMVRINLYGG